MLSLSGCYASYSSTSCDSSSADVSPSLPPSDSVLVGYSIRDMDGFFGRMGSDWDEETPLGAFGLNLPGELMCTRSLGALEDRFFAASD